MIATYAINIDCGRDYTLDCTWKTTDGNPVDLTGFGIILTLKTQLSDPDPGFYEAPAPTVANLVLGKFSFTIPNNLTVAFTPGQAVYEIATKSPSGYKTNLLGGQANINQSIKRTIP